MEPALKLLRSAPAHHHASQEDLEVLHDVTDLGVDGQLERDRLRRRVYPQERLFCRVVHPVVDVELDVVGLPDTGAVDVGLVRQDHGGGDRARSHAVLLLVVADGAHDHGELLGIEAAVQNLLQEDGSRLAVHVSRNHVADVVEVAGYGREGRRPVVVAEPGEDVVRDPPREVGVTEPVLGEAEPTHDSVRLGDERGQDGILLDLLERKEARGRFPAHLLLHNPSPASSSIVSATNFRATALFTMRISVPGLASSVTSSSSILLMVPSMPPIVITSSPTWRLLTNSRCWRTRRCWGRISKK